MMFDYLEMHLDTAKFMVKTDRKAFRGQIGMVIFNAAFLVWDYYNGVHNGALLSQIAIGCMWINMLWTLCFLTESWSDLKHNRELLHFYEKRKADKNAQEAIEEYRKAKEFYERAYKNGLEGYLKANPEKPTSSNRGFQPSIVGEPKNPA
jgi:hypothetical protein